MNPAILRVSCLALATIACSGPPHDGPLEVARRNDCKPSFREASTEQIEASLGMWSVSFNVALIGCQDGLATLSDRDLEEMKTFLVSEALQWSDVFLRRKRLEPEFRQRVVIGLNDIVERDVIDDVLFHDIVMYDVSQTGIAE